MKKTSIKIIVIILLIAIALLVFMKKPEPNNDSAINNEQNASMAVEVIHPTTETWPIKIKAYGFIKPYEDTIISAEIGGYRLAKLYFNIGDSVKKGDLLAELSDENLIKELSKQEGLLKQAEANLKQAESNMKRAELLEKKGSLSEQQIEEYKINKAVALAAYEVSEAEVGIVKLQLSQTKITAPFDGVIYSREGIVGDIINSGAELYRIIKDDKYEWHAEIDSSLSYLVKKNDKVIATLNNKKTVNGYVRNVSPAVSTNTARSIVYVSLKDNELLNVGNFINGEIIIGESSVQVIPQSSLVMRDGRFYIYVVNDKNIVSNVAVEKGDHQDGFVEILTPLDSNLKIVKKGGAFLTNGMKVSIVNTEK